MSFVVDLLRENPLLLLFVVAAIGYPLGRIRIGEARLGVAAVLFVGLAFGALNPDLKLPEEIYLLGLVLFVYTIGLASGSMFFSALRRKGWQDNLLIAIAIGLAAVLTALLGRLLGFSAARTAGMFAGSLTNTPALAGIIENLQSVGAQEPMLSEPVIAYSLTYPMGVLAMLMCMTLVRRWWKVDFAKEARSLPDLAGSNEPLQSWTVEVTRPVQGNIAELVRRNGWQVVFGRIRRDGKSSLIDGSTVLQPGDLITLVGATDDLEQVTRSFGKKALRERLDFDLSRYDKRRFLVSSQQIIGKRLGDLNLIGRFGGLVTRVRRGDVELLPHGSTVLAPGDQLRIVAPHQQMKALEEFLGDSYKAVSEIDILTFSLGLAVGLLIGMVHIPFPGGVTLKMGNAGGPLVVALILGALGRTGPLNWTIPYSANLTLRQIGLILFLAGIGTRAGYSFVATITQGSGLLVFAAGALITFSTTLFILWVGYRILKIPMGLLIGIAAGMQTQPAVLGFALEQSENELPNIGYATVYPAAMLLKILIAQVLLALLR